MEIGVAIVAISMILQLEEIHCATASNPADGSASNTTENPVTQKLCNLRTVNNCDKKKQIQFKSNVYVNWIV